MFSWIRTSPRKGKEPAERNFELTASKDASRKLSTPAVVLEELLNESSNKLSSEMVSDLRDCSLKVEDETKTNFTDQEVGREFPRRLCDPLPQYDFIVSAVVPL